MTTTPADELRVAAEQLRGHAEAAHQVSPGPWSHDDQCVFSDTNLIVADRSCAGDNGHPEQVRNLPYIALMGPGVGLALVNWLDETARYASLYASLTIATTGALPAEEEYDSLTRHALAVARQILGKQGPKGLTTGTAAPSADRAAILREAADAVWAMDYEQDANDYGYDSIRDAWDGGTMDASKYLRRMADEVLRGSSCRHCNHPSDWHDEWEGCVGPNGIGGVGSGDCTCTRRPETILSPAVTEDRRSTVDLLANSAIEYRITVPEGGSTELRVRRDEPGIGASWAVMVRGYNGGRAWTREGWQEAISALRVGQLFCWPDATSAVDEARRAPAVTEETGR